MAGGKSMTRTHTHYCYGCNRLWPCARRKGAHGMCVQCVGVEVGESGRGEG